MGGRRRNLLFVDVRQAHLNPRCEEDVYIELPEECGLGKEVCGKLNFWLYGFRPAASAWESMYAVLLEDAGFKRGMSCGVVFYHVDKDIAVAVHGDDFTFCGIDEDLNWILSLMKSWFEVKLRAILGPGKNDEKEVVIFGRIVKWTAEGIEYEADPKHRRIVLEYFGFQDNTRPLVNNGEKDRRNCLLYTSDAADE